MNNFQRAAHSTTDFVIFGSNGLPTELPDVSIYGKGGQPNLHGKIPLGSVARLHPMDNEVSSFPFPM